MVSQISRVVFRSPDLVADSFHISGELELLQKQLEKSRVEIKEYKRSETQAQEAAETADAEVKRITALVEEKTEKIRSLLDVHAENERLSEENFSLTQDIRKLQFELDGVRSNFDATSPGRPQSIHGTPSRRLGAELARTLQRESEDTSPTKASNEEAEADSSFTETIIRRYKGKSKQAPSPLQAQALLVEAATQTDAQEVDNEDDAASTVSTMPASASVRTLLADDSMEGRDGRQDNADESLLTNAGLPSYDEAAVHKRVLDTAHPVLIGELDSKLLEQWPEYGAIVKILQVRCDVLEQRMLAAPRDPPAVVKAPRPATSYSLISPALLDALALKGKAYYLASLSILSLAFLLGIIFTTCAMPGQVHYHLGPFTEKAGAWRDAHSFLFPPGVTHFEDGVLQSAAFEQLRRRAFS